MSEALDQTEPEPTVMIVEPDILARVVLAEYLRGCGYKVIEGATAEDVFTILKARFKVDVFLIEIKLPGVLNGFEVAQQIRVLSPDSRMILSSSVKLSADRAAHLCDEGPMERPYHPREVVRRIERLARLRSAAGPG